MNLLQANKNTVVIVNNAVMVTVIFSASVWDTRAPKTPRSVLSAASLITGPLTNRPLLTASGRPISFVHQERTRSIVLKRGSSTLTAGAVSLHDIFRRPRTHSRHPVVSFAMIDEHARKVKLTTVEQDNVIKMHHYYL